MEVYKGYKFRIYPTEFQQREIDRILKSCRYVYNGMLEYKEHRYRDFNENVSANQLDKLLTKVKKTDIWLDDIPRDILTYEIRNLDRAYKNFYRKNTDHPTKKFKVSSFTTRRKFIEYEYLKFNGMLGRIKIALHSNFKPCFIENEVVISKSAVGKYYVSVVVLENVEKLELTNNNANVVLKVNKILVNETEHPIPAVRHLVDRIAEIDSKLCNHTKNSTRYNKLRKTRAKKYEKIKNIRDNFYNTLSKEIVSKYDVITIDKEEVVNTNKGMLSFIQMLKTKCDWYGKKLIVGSSIN
ncbi:MAG: RNA-guided endonuclease InsQ/TnpB family protein [Peptostreptococcaceae bacterium]